MSKFEFIVKDEGGTVIRQIKTDCVMAVVNNPEKKGIEGISLTCCDTSTVAVALVAMDKVKKQACSKNPILAFAEKIGALNAPNDKVEKEPAADAINLDELLKKMFSR